MLAESLGFEGLGFGLRQRNSNLHSRPAACSRKRQQQLLLLTSEREKGLIIMSESGSVKGSKT